MVAESKDKGDTARIAATSYHRRSFHGCRHHENLLKVNNLWEHRRDQPVLCGALNLIHNELHSSTEKSYSTYAICWYENRIGFSIYRKYVFMRSDFVENIVRSSNENGSTVIYVCTHHTRSSPRQLWIIRVYVSIGWCATKKRCVFACGFVCDVAARESSLWLWMYIICCIDVCSMWHISRRGYPTKMRICYFGVKGRC